MTDPDSSSLPNYLGIETTCDETAAAVFRGDAHVLSSVVASQISLHQRFGGVVPEIASRAHHRQLLPVIHEALEKADVRLQDIKGIAVAYMPGLIGAILVGLTAAKTLALALDVPLVGVNHLEGHLFACQMVDPAAFPSIGLVISGGHTNLFRCESATKLEMIGSTIDDAAGESFDKVASMLGLGYPGGPAIEKASRQGNPSCYAFPRSLIRDDNFDFSFSGLKTAVLYTIRGQNVTEAKRELSAAEVSDLAASFQQAVIDVVVSKCLRALSVFRLKTLCVGGGVAANGALRKALQEACTPLGVKLIIPPMSLCTDNAAMAAVACERFRSGATDSLDLDAVAGMVRFR